MICFFVFDDNVCVSQHSRSLSIILISLSTCLPLLFTVLTLLIVLCMEIRDGLIYFQQLKLEPLRLSASYEPRKKFNLKITGDPEATVGLVAVDKGVIALNKKYRLTQKKVIFFPDHVLQLICNF